MLLTIRRRSLIIQPLARFATDSKSAQKEEKFDYSRKDFYALLNVEHSANDRQLKLAYFKMAKLYHPDVYKGINQDHFKKVSEAYNTLKNPVKRSEYDRR